MADAIPSARSSLPGLSGRALFFLSLAISLFVAIGLAASILIAADRTDRVTAETVEARLLALLEDGGTGNLMLAIDRRNTALLPRLDRVEVALWRNAPAGRSLLRASSPGAAEAFAEIAPGSTGMADYGGTRFTVIAVDVARASADWDLPMSDVELRFGIARPTAATRTARRTLILVGIGYGLAVAAGLALQMAHWRRYRDGLREINGVLDRYAAGHTGARPAPTDVPELKGLVANLDTVLPKLDTLFDDLRAISAHLAHELKTPLQAIRSDLTRLAATDDTAAKDGIIREIDRKIDGANARLQTVMQLFRLQSDATVPMDPAVPLGALLVDLVYDFEDVLEARGRTLSVAVDEDLTVRGNRYLLELMIENLLANAAKYAPEGVAMNVSLAAEGPGFALEVGNGGGGFPAGLAETAFTRFTRGEDHHAATGVGLGLSLVKAIVEKHGFRASLPDRTGADGVPMAVVRIEGPLAEPRHG